MSKKDKTTRVFLTRKQILMMADMVNHFSEVNDFVIEISHESGIGPSMKFRFDLDLAGETTNIAVNTTDVSNW
jgi:hypothetical protein